MALLSSPLAKSSVVHCDGLRNANAMASGHDVALAVPSPLIRADVKGGNNSTFIDVATLSPMVRRIADEIKTKIEMQFEKQFRYVIQAQC